MFAEKHLTDDLKALRSITNTVIREMRLKIARQLMLCKVFLTGCCPKCGFDIGNDECIKCKSCKRAYHFKPYCIEDEVEDLKDNDDFQCRLCRINFWPQTLDENTVKEKKVMNNKSSKEDDREITKTTRSGLRIRRKKRKRSSFLYWTPKKKSRQCFCVCNKPDDGRKYWQCEECDLWYHSVCLGMREDQEPHKFICRSCQMQCDEKDRNMNSLEQQSHKVFVKYHETDDSHTEDSCDSDGEDKIDDVFIESKVVQVHKMIEDILSCGKVQCDEHSHIRHHNFIANCADFCARNSGKFLYGIKYFKSKTIENLQTNLVNNYMYGIRDPKYPVTGAKSMMIKFIPKEAPFYDLLIEKKVVGQNYISFVLIKEVITFLVALKLGISMEVLNEKCLETEIDMAQEMKRRRQR